MRKGLLLLGIALIISLLSACKPTADVTASLNPGLDTVEYGVTWVDAGCTTTGDSCDLIEGSVDTSTIGTYELIYEATQGEQSIYLKRVVTVVDINGPVIILQPGVDSILVGDTWVDAGCEATDVVDGVVDCIVSENPLDSTTQGTYVIVYQAIDSSGNTTVQERYVTVKE